uniref:phosphoethanolamine N-methyltransferase-like isoform X2 n=1 Tax=Ciona intestinalis TaxID=7719 RepID=UPI0002B8D757|nr:phosphoethanolamine N-methyltransferase-like isoform X2 [Ciona intestinalis]|eukprot:XP_026694631.1 phosphoethanolamine N-methyltransferase-like isoform X2 [Ciona intestinalis]
MEEFWATHAVGATACEMMLDSNENVSEPEVKEILQVLPNYEDKEVLELGAGIGRFTSHLCDKAKNVVAVDFMQKFLDRNREDNCHRNNLQLKCDNVMNLEFSDLSFDLVFSNWLFMYLYDDDAKTLLSRILKWLRPGGKMFFRESCFTKVGNKKLEYNPSVYRSTSDYNDMITSTTIKEGSCGFNVLTYKPLQTYIKYKGNEHQMYWVMERGPKLEE